MNEHGGVAARFLSREVTGAKNRSFEKSSEYWEGQVDLFGPVVNKKYPSDNKTN